MNRNEINTKFNRFVFCADRYEIGSLIPRKIILYYCACYRVIWNFIDNRFKNIVKFYENLTERENPLLCHSLYLNFLRNEIIKYTDNVIDEECNLSFFDLMNHAMSPVFIGLTLNRNSLIDTSNYLGCLCDNEIGPIFVKKFMVKLFDEEIKPHKKQVSKLDPRWLSSTVMDLSRTIYDERFFERMPILGDALMDAGCDDDNIINHCGSDCEHYLGCWVLDLILGKI